MSYLRPLNTDVLPSLNESSNSARRIRALEEELAAYRRGNTPRAGILKHNDGGSGSETRRAIVELQEQVKSFQDELRKKDSMIQRFIGVEPPPPRPSSGDRVRFDVYQGDISLLERSRADIAALQVRIDQMTEQQKDYELQLEAKDIKIKELQNRLESNLTMEARHSDFSQSLQRRVHELEEQLALAQSSSNRGELTVSALQHELREANEKIAELESRLRLHRDDHEVNASRTQNAERRLVELVSQLAGLLNASGDSLDPSSPNAIEIIVQKLTDLVQENALLKGKLVTLNDALNDTQLESKASRDTITRLVAEMGREQKITTRYTSEVESLRLERDNAIAARCDLEREIQLLKERLEANQTLLDTTKAELDLRDNRLLALDREMRVTSHSVHSTSTAFQLFREQLANLLGTAFENADSSEEALKEAVRKLVITAQEHRIKTDEYEARVLSLTEQLNKQVELHRELELRAQHFESSALNLDSKLRSAAGELAASDVLREGFKFDKEKYLRGLQKLGEVMKMDHISLDLGLDSTLDALIVRAEQLVKLEGNALADRSTHIYNLQRKVKSLKEQLESKDLHIDLLRKKLTSLEERLHGRVIVEKDAEAESLRIRKLERLVDKYKVQLTDARQEIENLRAQLMGTTELHVRTEEQRKDVAELARQVEELEEVRRQQAYKITALKEEIACSESQTHEKRLVSDNAVQALSSELRTTKNALDSMKYREKQLLDFRGVVARMLGLDVNTLAVADYEIISRLEKLMKSQPCSIVGSVRLGNTLVDSGDGGIISDLEASDPVVRRSRDKSRRKGARVQVRARSLSPVKRDPRVY